MSRKHAVVDDEVLVRARDERGAACEEIERVQVAVGGSVVPRSLELEQDAAVGSNEKAVVRQRGARTVAHQALEGVSLLGMLGGDAHAGVQVVAVGACDERADIRSAGRDPGAAEAAYGRVRVLESALAAGFARRDRLFRRSSDLQPP